MHSRPATPQGGVVDLQGGACPDPTWPTLFINKGYADWHVELFVGGQGHFLTCLVGGGNPFLL
jgi:hypothetical protein